MSTITVNNIIDYARSILPEATTDYILDSEFLKIINDGYKDVSVKSLCYEKTITKTFIDYSSLIPLTFNNVIKVNYIEYNKGMSGCVGMTKIIPQAIGHIPITGYSPQYWFQWGDYIKIEPIPDVLTYNLNVYTSCYPDSELTSGSSILTYIPNEFDECVLLYTVYTVCIKLRRWNDVSSFYNKYIDSIKIRRNEYIIKNPDSKLQQDLPEKVSIMVV